MKKNLCLLKIDTKKNIKKQHILSLLFYEDDIEFKIMSYWSTNPLKKTSMKKLKYLLCLCSNCFIYVEPLSG